MSKTTTNFGFIKPELTDAADITQTNPNWDAVDAQLKSINDNLDNLSTDAGDLTGTLSIEHGGTGATTLNKARENLDIDKVNNTADSEKSVASAATAGKVANSITIQANGGTIENTNKWTYDGSDSKTINITYNKIGAASLAGLNGVASAITEHKNDKNNPHGVTADQLQSGTLDSDRLPVVPIEKGGTGATTVAGARTNLGVVSSFYTPDLYVWHKTANSLDGYSYDDVVNCDIGLYVYGTTTLYYSGEFEIVNNVVHLVNPVHLSGKTSDDFAPIIGKFVTAVIGGGASGYVYKIPEGATLSVGTNGLTVDRAQKVTPHPYTGFFVASEDKNAYPTSGLHTDGWWYKYCGKLGEIPYSYGRADLRANASALETGKLYFVYE